MGNAVPIQLAFKFATNCSCLCLVWPKGHACCFSLCWKRTAWLRATCTLEISELLVGPNVSYKLKSSDNWHETCRSMLCAGNWQRKHDCSHPIVTESSDVATLAPASFQAPCSDAKHWCAWQTPPLSNKNVRRGATPIWAWEYGYCDARPLACTIEAEYVTVSGMYPSARPHIDPTHQGRR